jgi:hypothetical protein
MRRRPKAEILLLILFAAAAPLAGASRQAYSLAVIVDGCEAPEYEHLGRVYVEALRGRNFSLRISNPTSGRVAVALSVDGRNVIDASRTSSLEATKWVLSPGETIDIPGWQVSGQNSRRFFFTETSGSYAKWLGDTRNVGTIEAVFFREKRLRPLPLQGTVGDRNTREPLSAPAPADAAAAEAPTGAVVPKKSEADRFAATGIGERTDFPVQWIPFEPDPEPAARIALRYEFHRELLRLGVLPRSDDAFAARDRARGFEPSYAPDPDRQR